VAAICDHLAPTDPVRLPARCSSAISQSAGPRYDSERRYDTGVFHEIERIRYRLIFKGLAGLDWVSRASLCASPSPEHCSDSSRSSEAWQRGCISPDCGKYCAPLTKSTRSELGHSMERWPSFLVITVTHHNRRFDGTVFETTDGTRFVVRAAQTHDDANTKAAAAGSEARVFASARTGAGPRKNGSPPIPLFGSRGCRRQFSRRGWCPWPLRRGCPQAT
jgi:hypothetical protein